MSSRLCCLTNAGLSSDLREALRRWMVWYRDGYSIADAESWIQHTIETTARGDAFHFAMVDHRTEFVGVISIEDVQRETGRAMLGYLDGLG